MGKIQPYRAERFGGNARSYGGQGVCSKCHDKPAAWMGITGAVMLAYCDRQRAPVAVKGLELYRRFSLPDVDIEEWKKIITTIQSRIRI